MNAGHLLFAIARCWPLEARELCNMFTVDIWLDTHQVIIIIIAIGGGGGVIVVGGLRYMYSTQIDKKNPETSTTENGNQMF
jgi:hypothetical protein